MQRDASAHGQLDVRDALAFFAAQRGFTQAHLAEWPGRGPCADALELAAAAVVAHVRGQGTATQAYQLRLRLFQLRVGLVQIRLELLCRRVGLAARALQLGRLGLQRLQPFSQDLRTAVFVDQFLNQFEWVHGWPIGLKVEEVRHAA